MKSYMLLEDPTTIDTHGQLGLEVDIYSNYRDYVTTIRFIKYEDEYYFRKADEYQPFNDSLARYYKCSTTQLKDIIRDMYGDTLHDHSTISMLFNNKEPYNVYINEKGWIYD